MDGSRYIWLRFLLVMYILMSITPTLSVDQDYSMDGPNNCVQKVICNPHETLSYWNKIYCVNNIPFKLRDLDSHQLMLETGNLDVLDKLYVFLTSEVFPVRLIKKALNLDIFHSFFYEELGLSFPKFLEPNYDKFGHKLFDGYFVLWFCACFTILLLHKRVKNEDANSQGTKQGFINMSNAVTSLSSMLNIKGEREIADIFSSDDEADKYGWIFKRLHRFVPWKFFVYPVVNTEYGRFASFSRLAHTEVSSEISFVKLANAGFILMDKGPFVKCQGCGTQEVVWNFTSSPSEGKYHTQGCSFVQEEDFMQEQNGNIDSLSVTQNLDSVSSITDNTFGPSHVKPSITSSTSSDSLLGATGYTIPPLEQIPPNTGFPQIPLDTGFPLIPPGISIADFSDDTSRYTDDTESDAAPDIERQDHLKNDSHFHNKPDPNINSRTLQQKNSSNFTSEPQTNLSVGGVEQQTDQAGITQLGVPKESVGQREMINSAEPDRPSGYFSDTEVFDDSDLFQAECDGFYQDVQTSKEACKKNPGHYGYFPIWNFKMDYIPSKVRHPDVFSFFELVSNLTVRVVVGKTSKERPTSDLVEQGRKCRLGTGYAVSEPESCYHLPNNERTTHPGKWGTVKKYLHIARHKDLIYIQTSRHLVYDETEAQSATVEFFYHNPNRRGIVIAKGVSVSHSSIVGDMRSILICKTSDLSLVKMVKESTNEIKRLAQNFSPDIKKEMMKRVFLIGHPHGGEKMFSYGEYVMVKFALTQENVNGHPTARIVRIKNNTQISQNPGNIWKTLFYTADTCNGSTGSPVVSFTETGSGDAGNIILDMWIHNGVGKKNILSVSTMRELTPDDVANHGHTEVIRPSIQEEMSAEAERAANQVISCAFYKVMKPPAHPAYVAYTKRLHSYPNPLIHVHTAEDLANNGFFYAGYIDCVRCFQCGLGLSSWKPGDSIIEEHKRNRPDCQFLQLKLREAGLPAIECQSNGEQAAVVDPPAVNPQVVNPSVVDPRVDALEGEQKYLKQNLTCKVCCKKQVKELFLPCGELVACIDCSKLLTHCPSCSKKILATVKIYFK